MAKAAAKKPSGKKKILAKPPPKVASKKVVVAPKAAKPTKPAPKAKVGKAPEKTIVNLMQVGASKNGKPTRLAKPSLVTEPERHPARNRGIVEERHIAPIPEAVPTDGKPRKNQVGFSPRDLELFRDSLLAKRRELVGDMSAMERKALRSSGETNLSTLPVHMADMGTDNYEQEFTLGLVEKDRNLLKEINAALAKIQNGTFGICEGTGKPIGRPRLEAQPWSRFSIEYARKLEVRRGF